MLKKILLVLLIVLIVIQFIKPQKNIHAGPQPADISTLYHVPPDVDSLLVIPVKIATVITHVIPGIIKCSLLPGSWIIMFVMEKSLLI